MPKTIRSIIVGMGGISRTMLRALGEKDWHEVAAIVDVNEDALGRAGADLSLPDSARFTDLDRAFAEASADAALINTPSEWHYPQTDAALRAGWRRWSPSRSAMTSRIRKPSLRWPPVAASS